MLVSCCRPAPLPSQVNAKPCWAHIHRQEHLFHSYWAGRQPLANEEKLANDERDEGRHAGEREICVIRWCKFFQRRWNLMWCYQTYIFQETDAQIFDFNCRSHSYESFKLPVADTLCQCYNWIFLWGHFITQTPLRSTLQWISGHWK